jgi:hypothetical protein
MALPLIAAGIAARVIAKKLAKRAVGGISGSGAKFVGTEYRNMGTGSVKVTSPKGPKDVVNFNTSSASKVKDFKSGAKTKRSGNSVEADNIQGIMSGKTGDPKIIKINSGNTRAR